MSNQFKPGTPIVRSIDGLWFDAVVEAFHRSAHAVTIKYVDDGNIEEMVPIEEIQLHSGEAKSSENNIHHVTDMKLLRPLAGLTDDDSDDRKEQTPTVILHKEGDTELAEHAIIINGTESKLAVGGGLRALRYLK